VYLGRVVADLESGHRPDAETAARHANFHLHRVPEAFRDDCLSELIAETALAVVNLRRDAAARPAGIDPVQWLDSVDTDWRSRFPVQIEDSTVAQLIEGLVRNAIAPPPETQLISRLARIRDGKIEFGMDSRHEAAPCWPIRPPRLRLWAMSSRLGTAV
jgi:hypothetical protein